MSGDYFPGSQSWYAMRALTEDTAKRAEIHSGGLPDIAGYVLSQTLYDHKNPAERKTTSQTASVASSPVNPALLRRLGGDTPIRFDQKRTSTGNPGKYTTTTTQQLETYTPLITPTKLEPTFTELTRDYHLSH